MKHGPYEPEEPQAPRTAGRIIHRTWMSIRCLNTCHDGCDDLRCDCACHGLVTGAWRHVIEPA